jgi:thioester reductase-like protein
VRHLIDLCLASKLPSPPRLVFISSIGVVNGYNTDAGVAEGTVENENLLGARGYGEAKFVSERVLEKAARVSGVPATIIRSGQIAGSSIDGYWAPTEYMPTIFRSSKILGKVPNKLPVRMKEFHFTFS